MPAGPAFTNGELRPQFLLSLTILGGCMFSFFNSGRISWINPFQVLIRAAGLLKTCFLPLLLLTLLGQIPSFFRGSGGVLGFVFGFLGVFLAMASGSAQAMVLIHGSQDEDLETIDCLKSSLTFDLVKLAGLAIVIFMPLFIVFGALSYRAFGNPARIGLLILTAAVIFRVLAVYLMAIPICVLDGQGVISALRVSRALAKGNYLTILLVWLVTGLISGVLVFILFKFFQPLLPKTATVIDLLTMNNQVLHISQFLWGNGSLAMAAAAFLSQTIMMMSGSLITGTVLAELMLSQESEEMDSMAETFK
jgi:hypothetical protein